MIFELSAVAKKGDPQEVSGSVKIISNFNYIITLQLYTKKRGDRE